MINKRQQRIDDAGDVFVSHGCEHRNSSSRLNATLEFFSKDVRGSWIVGHIENPFNAVQMAPF